MEAYEILKTLREKHGLTQEQLAEKVLVTRQAVSRWENGETQPNTETLKLLSRLFDVSINTLLGAPRTLIGQCCGMPLTEDSMISREPDGGFNEDYCTSPPRICCWTFCWPIPPTQTTSPSPSAGPCTTGTFPSLSTGDSFSAAFSFRLKEKAAEKEKLNGPIDNAR